jgi:hypothetical protein
MPVHVIGGPQKNPKTRREPDPSMRRGLPD